MGFVNYKDLSKEIPKGTIGKIRINVHDWPKKDTQFVVLAYSYFSGREEVLLKILVGNEIWIIDLMNPNEISLLAKEE